MFNTKKIPHFHPCPCHIVESQSMKDETGKVWTMEEIEQHFKNSSTAFVTTT